MLRFATGEKKQICDRAGITYSRLSNYLNGKSNIPGHMALALQEATDGRITAEEWIRHNIKMGGKDGDTTAEQSGRDAAPGAGNCCTDGEPCRCQG